MSKVFVAACLNVCNGDEREFAVAVIGSECAVLAPKVKRLVAYTVCIGCARLKVRNRYLVAVEITELVNIALREGLGIGKAAVEFSGLNDLNIASCIGLGVPAEAP